MSLNLNHAATAVTTVIFVDRVKRGVWGMLFTEHSSYAHRQAEITCPEYQTEMDKLVYQTQLGSTPWLWAGVHRYHHMFADVRGLDFYSRFDRGFMKTLLLSAVYVHEAKSVPEIVTSFPDLIPTPEQAHQFSSPKRAYALHAARFAVLPNLIVLPMRSPKAHAKATALGVAAGTMTVMIVMFGGGAINSIAHWASKRRFARTGKALDGSTAANHPLLAKLTGIREFFHWTHHNHPTELDFSVETPSGSDYVAERCKGLEAEGKVSVGFQRDPDEMFDIEVIARVIEGRANRDDLARWYRDVIPNFSAETFETLHPFRDDEFRHYAEVGRAILTEQWDPIYSLAS